MAETKADKLTRLNDAINAAERYIDANLAKGWRETMRNFDGDYEMKGSRGKGHEFYVNVVHALTTLIVPALYFKDPQILCNPIRQGDERGCKITESVINYWIRELGVKKQAQMALQDAFLFGAGYMKLGYIPDYEVVFEPVTNDAGVPLSTEADEPIMKDAQGNVFVERGGRMVQIMDKDGSVPPQSQEVVSVDMYMRRGQLFATRWEPWNFLKDPESKRADCTDASWVAFRAVLPLKEVKNNPHYKNTSNLRGSQISKNLVDKRSIFPFMRTQVDEENDRVEIYEVWEKVWNTGRRRYDYWQYVIAKGHKSFLMEQKSPYLAEGFPVSVLTFLEHPKEPYGVSVLESIRPQIDTINTVRAEIAAFREDFRPKYVGNETVITAEEARKIVNSESPLVMATMDEGVDANSAIRILEAPSIPEALFQDYQLAWEEVRRVTGITEDMLGGAGPGRQATQASFIQGAANVRLSHKQDMVGEFVLQLAKYWTQLLKQFGTYEMALRIEGAVTPEEWAIFTVAEEIPDDIQFDVDVFPSAIQSKEMQLETAMNMYNLLRQDPMVNPEKLISKVLKAFGEPAPEGFLMQQQPVDPLAQQHGGAATGSAIDANQLRQPTQTGAPGETGRAPSGEVAEGA